MRSWILLIRHGSAGSRRKWEGPDHLRPLDKKGRRQADGLGRALEQTLGLPADQIDLILSSPFVRCVETVDPLARSIGRQVGPDVRLAEGHQEIAAELFWSQVRRDRSDHASSTVLCTHGDVVPALLDEVAASGADLGPVPKWPKGSVWAVEIREGSVAQARYVTPVV